MPNCEYRLGNPSQEGTIGRLSNVIVAVSGDKHICRVHAEEGNQIYPVCELPEKSDTDCPIALYKKGEIDLTETNRRLTKIYSAEKKVKKSKK